MSATSLGVANQESQFASGGYEIGRGGKDGVELFDGSQSDYVSAGCGCGGPMLRVGLRSGQELLGSTAKYIDVGQCKSADHFAQEGSFFVVGFNEREADVRRPELHGQSGETRSGANVDDVRLPRAAWLLRGKQVACGEERLSEMAGDDFFGATDGGQIDARIPAE